MTGKSVILGKIAGVQGLKGWLKVISYTRPLENIFQYGCWNLQNASGVTISYELEAHKYQGRKLLVKMGRIDDRTTASTLVGCEIIIDQNDLPVLSNEYYWRDLIGLTVRNTADEELGEVIDLMETGSNDVLLLRSSQGKSLAIPWLPEVVREVDIERSLMIVEWEPLI
jgi:16S rRNA processing protein RimM